MLCGDVTYFLWYVSRPSYKNIKIWGVRFYIINGHVTRNNIDYRSHCAYFMGYATTAGVIIYWKSDHPFSIHISHHYWFDEYNPYFSI